MGQTIENESLTISQEITVDITEALNKALNKYDTREVLDAFKEVIKKEYEQLFSGEDN